jgi:hypothetical protein
MDSNSKIVHENNKESNEDSSPFKKSNFYGNQSYNNIIKSMTLPSSRGNVQNHNKNTSSSIPSCFVCNSEFSSFEDLKKHIKKEKHFSSGANNNNIHSSKAIENIAISGKRTSKDEYVQKKISRKNNNLLLPEKGSNPFIGGREKVDNLLPEKGTPSFVGGQVKVKNLLPQKGTFPFNGERKSKYVTPRLVDKKDQGQDDYGEPAPSNVDNLLPKKGTPSFVGGQVKVKNLLQQKGTFPFNGERKSKYVTPRLVDKKDQGQDDYGEPTPSNVDNFLPKKGTPAFVGGQVKVKNLLQQKGTFAFNGERKLKYVTPRLVEKKDQGQEDYGEPSPSNVAYHQEEDDVEEDDDEVGVEEVNDVDDNVVDDEEEEDVDEEDDDGDEEEEEDDVEQECNSSSFSIVNKKLLSIRSEFSSSFIGSCEEMCPENERNKRISTIAVSKFEMEHKKIKGTFATMMVKEFKRSSADNDDVLRVPEWVRTPDCLFRTIRYIEDKIMEKDKQGNDPRFCKSDGSASSPSSIEVYLFIFDRYRMISKDFILQNNSLKKDAIWVESHERMARWYILMDHHMQKEGIIYLHFNFQSINNNFV